MRCKIIIGFAVFSLLQQASFLSATTWYVDSSATSGADNGTSWANAWLSPTNISGVSAGDTVYISGGPSGGAQDYPLSTPWNIIGGNSTNWVTYQIGQDSAHNGYVLFDNQGQPYPAHFLYLRNGINFSGNAGDGRNHFVLTNFDCAFDDANVTNIYIGYVNMGSNLLYGFNSGGSTVQNIEVDHVFCYLGGTNPDHFLQWLQCAGGWDSCRVHNCTIYLPKNIAGSAGVFGFGPDGFQAGGCGFSCYSNTILSCWATTTNYDSTQHQDGWQPTGSDVDCRCYNNFFLNIAHAAAYLDVAFGPMTNIYVYNNIMVWTNEGPNDNAQAVDCGEDGISATLNGIVIANNLADGYTERGWPAYALNNVHYTNALATNCIVANNIAINQPANEAVDTTGFSNITLAANVFLTNAMPATYFSSFTANSPSNDYHLTSSAVLLLGQGINLSSYFTVDADNRSRPTSGAWDVGPYQYSLGFGSTDPVISVAPTSASYGSVPVGEAATNILTVRNTSGGILTGNASVSAPFTIISGGSYSLGSNQSQTVAIAYVPSTPGTNVQSVVFSGGNGASCQLIGIAVPANGGSLSNPTFPVADGAITSPFILTNGYIYQTIQTTNPGLGGSAIYNFTVTNAGNYVVQGFVNAPSDAANSFYINIDAQPTDPMMIWDIPVTTGFTNQTVCWRGNGTDVVPEYVPKVFTLSAGTHQLIIRGREAGAQLSQITIVPAPPEPYIDPPTGLHVAMP